MEYEALLSELERLLKETYALWEPGWVTFNWRGYTFDHVQRVRGLALNICRQEGGDARIVELAALLHDITKPYDGDYIVDEEGNRVVDERGYWRNRTHQPVRHNVVTDLYDDLHLMGKPHNESGAVVANHLLRRRGLKASTCERVAQTIRQHLLPPPDLPIEGRCLCDADTIDANIGLPAFVRNIYIHLHFHDLRKAPEEPSVDTLLAKSPSEYLEPYIIENLPRWVMGKRRDFVPRLQTDTAREIALARLERLEGVFQELEREARILPSDEDHQYLEIVLHYMHHRQDPSIAEETESLANSWPAPRAEGRKLIRWLQREMKGIE
ncbi:MAG: HD domain-containing protein [Chloroflexota bacterium]|nr:HD domain-containing protein [Chloroflexota bacterium]